MKALFSSSGGTNQGDRLVEIEITVLLLLGEFADRLFDVREVTHHAAGAELTDIVTDVAALEGGEGILAAFPLGTHLLEFLLGEVHRCKEPGMLGLELVGFLEVCQAPGELVGLLLQGCGGGSGAFLEVGRAGCMSVADCRCDAREAFFQLSNELLVAASFEVDGDGELDVDLIRGLLGRSHDPLTVELEEVLVEDEELAAIG